MYNQKEGRWRFTFCAKRNFDRQFEVIGYEKLHQEYFIIFSFKAARGKKRMSLYFPFFDYKLISKIKLA